MSSRRTVRRLLVGTLVGVLVGGGLMVLTPAGAEVSSAMATNWKKIWNKELKPQADKRYYTKKKSDKRYYKKSDSDAKYQPKGNYAPAGSSYTKAESDARYAPAPRMVTGLYVASLHATAANQKATASISFGRNLATPPSVRVVTAGFDPPSGCGGSVSAPEAAPGILCIFERTDVNTAYKAYCATPDPACVPYSGRAGLYVLPLSAGAGYVELAGSWALGLS